MTLIDTTITTVDPTASIDQIDEQVLNAIDAEPKGKREKPTKLSKEEILAAENAEIRAKLDSIQAVVPWKVIVDSDYYSKKLDPYSATNIRQNAEIERWADDRGTYPTRYRAYSREEWTLAINQIAEAVGALADHDPEFQRSTGLYVEEHTKDLLLIMAKKWQLQIQVPSTSKLSGKRFDLKSNEQATNYYSSGTVSFHETFLDLLTNHIHGDHRDLILDICCQYLRTVRIQLNRRAWADQHPELAHLVAEKA